MEDEDVRMPLDGCGADDEILFHLHPLLFPWDPLCWLQKCVLVAPRDGVVAEVMTVPDAAGEGGARVWPRSSRSRRRRSSSYDWSLS
jgi:hypothetical protein